MANYLFILRAIKRLNFVRTKDNDLFEEYNDKKHKILYQFDKNYGDNNNIQNKLKGNLRIIDYSNYDFVWLYFTNFLGKYFAFEFAGQKFSI